MKKILLKLGTFSLVVLPILSVVSCGNDGTQDKVVTKDLNITAIPSAQTTIDKAIINFNKTGATDTDKIIALQTIFKGITVDNFKNFEVKATAGKIVLTAKPGFSFGTSETLTSTLVLDLKIVPKRVTQPTIDKAIINFNATGATESDQIAILQTIFKGITETNFKNFDVQATAGKITLISKPGFSFGTSKTLTSTLVLNLGISPIRVAQTTIDKAIIDFKIATTDVDKIKALSTIFIGITIENFKNLDVEATSTTGSTLGKVVLTAKPGFGFGTSTNLSSWSLDEKLDLQITVTPTTQTTIDNAIMKINASSATDVRIAALSTVFDGVTIDNFLNFTISTKITTGTMPGNITLTAKTDFTFDGEPTLVSSSITIFDLKITVAKGKIISQGMIDQAITDFNGATTDEVRITALLTIFDGIIADNFKHFTVKATATSGPTIGTVVLTAKTGFSFGKAQTLTSMIVSNLEGWAPGVAAERVAQTIIDKAIADINLPGATDETKITALQTVFKGITPQNFPNFTIKATPTTEFATGKIVLTAKPGFIFGTSETLSSIINLPIFAKLVGQQIIEDAIVVIGAPEATDEIKITTLKTIFNGITVDNFVHFDIDWHGPPGYQSLFLAAKDGFAFDGKGTIFSILDPTLV